VRRALREAAGLSLESIARAVGVTRQCVGHWETGRREVSPRYLRAYLDALRVLREAA
jgi:transcriptional regulator with XRE-family HTH domain